MNDLTLHFVRHGESLAYDADKTGRQLASTMRRARETAEGINEVLGLPVETDPDLHELRQSDAFYGSRGSFGDTASLNWMPSAPRDHAEPNTGISVFERRNRRMDGMDFEGWHLMTWNDRGHL